MFFSFFVFAYIIYIDIVACCYVGRLTTNSPCTVGTHTKHGKNYDKIEI